MSRPSAGTYFIYSRVTSYTGQQLTMTFNGENKAITVTPLDKSSKQRVRRLKLLHS
jgi:hypothetical protein